MDKLQALCIAAGIAASLLSISQPTFIPVAALIAISYYMLSRGKKRSTDYELLAFANELYNQCGRKGLMSALDCACRMPSARPELRRMAARMRLGDMSPRALCDPEDRDLNALAEIISTGAESGVDIRNNLKLFISRLESQISEKEKASQGALGMEVLSAAGIGFFVPLFGGIGASIISASGTISGSSAAFLVNGFEILVITYIVVMSFVYCLFSPGKKPSTALLSSLNAGILGAAILRLSALVMIYAI